MAISHTTQLTRGRSFRRGMTAILVAGVMTTAVAVAVGNVRGDETPPVAVQTPRSPSIHNLLPGIDEFSTAGGSPQAVAQPSVDKLFPGLDADATTAVTASAVESASVTLKPAPHLLEGIDGPYLASVAPTGPSAFTLWKLEQSRDETSFGNSVAQVQAGPGGHTLFKMEQARGEAADRSAKVRPNLVEGF